ncbi:immunoglobulin-like domain-containing protein [Paenibacillus konkukensis]|nr:immunoglobulin-like domain-containing protein [Paenibacillus konkukensis]
MTARSITACMLCSSFFGWGTAAMAQDSNAAASGYKDLGDSYAVKEIQALSDAGILSGFDGGLFKPHDAVTRAQMAKILVMSMGLQEKASAAAVFKDVPDDAWYRGFVGALVESGVTEGTAADKFSPDQTVTREELAAFFIRSFGLEPQAAKNGKEAKLSDFGSVSDWAKGDVAFAFNIGFIGGLEDGKGGVKFQPKDTAERQALARLGYEFKFNKTKYLNKADELLKSAAGEGSTGSTGSTDGQNAAEDTVSAVKDLIATTNTSMEVVFQDKVEAAAAADFQFDNGLTVSGAAVKTSMPNVVQLTTSAQTSGQVYRLTYKGKATGLQATGVTTRTSRGSIGSSKPSDPFAVAGTYNSDYTLTSSGTYGPADGETVINGTLTLDPGPEGEITLRNITAENIEIKSGAANSIHLMNVIVPHVLRIDTAEQANPVHVVTEGGSSIGALNILTPAILDLFSTGTIGSVTVNRPAAGTTLQLGTGSGVGVLNLSGDVILNGDFSQVLVSDDSGVSITTTDASAQETLVKLLSDLNGAAQAAGELQNKLSSAELTGDFDLPALSGTEAALQWMSGSDALSIVDGVHVKVTRGTEDTTVTLAVKITVGQAVREISFTFTIKGLPGQTGMTDEQKAQADKEALNLGDLSAVTANLTLPETGVNGSAITWATSDASVVTAAGAVTRPAIGQPDAKAVLTATVTSNAVSASRTFDVTVKAQSASGLTLAEVRGQADSATVATSGVVTTKSDKVNTFYMQDATGGILVYSPATKTAVNPGDQVSISSGVKTTYNGEIELTGAVFTVTGQTDVPAAQVIPAADVPSKGGQLVAVKHLIVSNLSGSNFDATDLDGNVIKVYGQKYAVNYGGAIANGDIVDVTGISVMFNTTVEIYPRSADDVVKQGKVSDADKVQLDKNALDLGDISAVYADLDLPAAGSNGSVITWTTSDAGIVSAAGQVNQPAFGQPDRQVTLTANLNLNGNLATRSFEITIKAQAVSDARAVANEAAVLYVFYDGVEAGVVLTDRGVDGTKVAWQLADASQSSIVNVATGAVTRAALAADTQVTLKAIISRGDQSALKPFTITVEAMKEQPTVNPVTVRDTTVTGTAKAGATVTVSAAGATLGSAAADASTGDFSVEIAPQAAGALLEISATGTDPVYMLVTEQLGTDLSGASLSVSTNKPASGQSFALDILNAKGQDGKALNGSIEISVTSSVYGKVYSGPVTFANGSASVSLTLDQAGPHKLTVQIAGVTASPSANVTVSETAGPVTIANGGFEVWGTDGMPDAWMGSGTNIKPNKVSQTTDAHTGSYAVQLINEDSKNHVRFTTQTISLVKDQHYYIKYWAKGSAKLRNSNALVGSSLAYDTYGDYKELSSAWALYDYDFIAKSSGDYVIIFSVLAAGDSSKSEAIIDDVTISTNP